MSCGCSIHGTPSCVAIVPIFQGLTPEEMSEVGTITRSRKAAKGEMIYTGEASGWNLFIIHTGKVKLSRITENGKEQVIRAAGPGEFFGELSLFGSSPSGETAEAQEVAVMCVIDGTEWKTLMHKYPSILWKVAEELSRRLERAERLIESINLRSVESRIALSLLQLAGDRREVTLPMTKGDWASQLGMSQESLSRKLTLFQEEGLIRTRGRRDITIVDPNGLRDVSYR